MKYCKKCGVLYTTEVCPKCGIEYPPPQQDRPLTEEEKKQRSRQWVGILIGVPLFILAIYAIIHLYYGIAGA